VTLLNINKNLDPIKNSILIPKGSLNASSIADNSWLAGFSAGDASFGVRMTESSVAKNHQNKVSLSFELVQSR